MAATISTSTDWADDFEEEIGRFASKSYTDENGLKVIIEYRENEDGKMVKITRKIKLTLKKENVNKAVASRKKWVKFGEEKYSKPGPNLQTTTVGEQIFLKLSFNQAQAIIEEEENKQKEQLKSKKIVCRLCKGDHFTSKCPYKDTIQPLDDLDSSGQAPKEGKFIKKKFTDVLAESATGSKYVAPHQRRGAGESAGESMRDKRDDSASLRVINLSEETRDSDVHDLFRKFGHIARVFLAKDHNTGKCKGFAFVSYSDRADAEKARAALDGHGYDNLILRVDWAQ